MINSSDPDTHKTVVKNVLEEINVKILLEILKRIYEERIYFHNRGIIHKIRLEIYCAHTRNCDEDFCEYSEVTQQDLDLVEVGFNIFLYLSYINDMFPDSPKLKHFRNMLIEEDDKGHAEEEEEAQSAKPEKSAKPV